MLKVSKRTTRLILKCETVGQPAYKVLCVSVRSVPDGEMFHCGDPAEIEGFLQIVSEADEIITHTPYHINALSRLYPAVKFDRAKVYDTSEVGKRLFPRQKPGLSDWAARLEVPRPAYQLAEEYSPKVRQRCDYDCKLVELVYYVTKEGQPL